MTDKQNIENTESIVQETETSVDLTKTLSQAGKEVPENNEDKMKRMVQTNMISASWCCEASETVSVADLTKVA